MFTRIFQSLARVVPILLCLIGLGSLAGAQENPDPRPEHPRPDFRREAWLGLNGSWLFRTDPGDLGRDEMWFGESLDEEFVRSLYDPIQVPFPWESELSLQEVRHQGIAWYRRSFQIPESWSGQRVFAVFGAVDHAAEVWANGTRVAAHEGGYTPFECDLGTDLRVSTYNDITVRVVDELDPHTLTGTQSLGFTPTSGIWQTVYLEARPATRLTRLRFRSSDPKTGNVSLLAEVFHSGEEIDSRLQIDFADAAVDDVDFEIRLARGVNRFERTFQIKEPWLWRPGYPRLYECATRLQSDTGQTLDSVSTYFGLRSVTVQSGAGRPMVHLNGHPTYLRGVVHGGLHPESLSTYPDDESIRRDIASALELGFNTIRVRSKIEDPRFYYWCDRLGCLAIQDLPSFESFGPRSMELAETTLREVIDRDFNHPSIIARVLFQEGRGIAMGGYDATRVEWVRSVVKLARELDGTRLVVDNIGRAPDHVDTDVAFWTLDTVDYDRAKEVIERRKDQPVGALFRSGTARETVPRMIGEFRAVQAGGGDRDASAAFFDLLGAVSHAAEFTAGFFYGALTDTEWDHAGLLNFDRTPKDFGRSIEGVAGPFVGVADDLRRLVDSTPGGTSGFTVHFQHLPQEGGTGKITGYSYSLDGIDYRGNVVQSNPVTTTSSRTIGPGVTHRASVDLPDKPFAGMLHFAVTKELPDSSGSISIPVILRHTNPPPRVSVFDDGKILALHFEPREFASIDPPPVADRHSGLMRFKGAGYVEYRLRLPDSIPLEKIAAVGFEAELAAAGDDRLLDWPVVRRRTDQPQTDSVETPSRVVVSVANETAAPLVLKKAPNDIRGVLSRSSGYPHAIYGDVHRVWIDDPKLQRRDIDVRLEVTSGAGLALFGRDMGRSLVAPALLLKLDSALDPVPDFAQTRTIRERLGDRSHVLVSTAEKDEVEWHYTLQRPLENWTSVDFDDGAWLKGPSAFGDSVDANDNVRTAWETPGIWLRRRFDATESDVDGQLYVRLRHQEDVDVFLNGTRILRSLGSRARYETVMLPEDLFVSLNVGENVLAVNCRNGLGTPLLDAGLLVDQKVE